MNMKKINPIFSMGNDLNKYFTKRKSKFTKV